MQILDSTQTVQTHPFPQQLQTTTRSGAKLRQPSATVPAKRRLKNTDQDFATSAMLVKNAVTFAAGIAFSIVLTAL